jgi:copper chaperone
MKTYKFKTNINCNGCIATVSPHLDQLQGIQWSVDTKDKDKILVIKGENPNKDQVVKKVKEAGFSIEEKKGFLGKLF